MHTIHQGGGEQGDTMMPFLFCLGQHAALEAIQRELNPNEKLFEAGQSRGVAQFGTEGVVGPLPDPCP